MNFLNYRNQTYLFKEIYLELFLLTIFTTTAIQGINQNILTSCKQNGLAIFQECFLNYPELPERKFRNNTTIRIFPL